jgi:NTP pyrophosphatase (non-canonical NTP hydrolase)
MNYKEIIMSIFADAMNFKQQEIHETAKEHGWWDEPRSFGDCIALMHSELSECLEGFRKGNPADEHCALFSSCEIELADCIIRILDLAGSYGYNIGGALEAKTRYNKSRPYRHGGKKL